MNAVAPIFIIGAPRSGTSITTWALGQHPNIQAMPETAWLSAHAVGSYLSWVKGSERGPLSHLSNVGWPAEAFMEEMGQAAHRTVLRVFDERCKQLYSDFRTLGIFERRHPEQESPLFKLRHSANEPKRRWVDGTPANSLYTWGLKLLFPKAKFIHNLRQPKDVIRSLLNFERAGGEKRELDEALKEWSHCVRFAYFTQLAFGPNDCMTVDFNRLTSVPDRELRKIFTFLDERHSGRARHVFKRKINSSNVEDLEIEELLAGTDGYDKALQLYQDALAIKPLEMEHDAMSLIQTQFLDHTLQRNLI